MSKYVGVRHESGQQQVYWFEVPDELFAVTSIGTHVICDTKKGEMPGVIVHVIDGMNDAEAARIIGAKYFPLKRVIAVLSEFQLPDIHIPFEMETESAPEPDEIADRMREFYATGGFQNVIFNADGTLLDGYSAYLVAKMFDHESLLGLIMQVGRG